MMEITVNISDEAGRMIFARANKEGKDIAAFAARVLEREAKRPNLDELLAPVRAQFAASGLTEDKLSQIVKEERRAIQREKAGLAK